MAKTFFVVCYYVCFFEYVTGIHKTLMHCVTEVFVWGDIWGSGGVLLEASENVIVTVLRSDPNQLLGTLLLEGISLAGG